MGRKVHPLGFRLGVIRDWQARWYSEKNFAEFVQEDLKLRKAIRSRYTDAGISQVLIERQANDVSITIYTARPGIVIGRGGQRVDEIRQYLERLIGKRVRLNIQEIRQPEMDAYLVARTIADQMEHRVAYRRAMKQAIFRTSQAGAKGVRVKCGGRLAGAEIARRETMHQGQVPLNTLRADIDYGFAEAQTIMGKIGVKVWIYKGEVLPEVEAEEMVEKPAEVVTEAALPPVTATVETPSQPEVSKAVEPARAASQPQPVASEVKEPPKPVAEEEKPAKPRVRRTRQAPAEKPAEAEKPKEKEVKDVTTQAG